MISTKNNSEIQKMRAAGRIVAQALALAAEMAQVGATTADMDAEIERFIRLSGATPSFKGFGGFPAATCMSVDDVVVHGTPSDRTLKSGEILSVDVGAYLDGFHADAARTFFIGEVSGIVRKLVEVTEQSFFKGLEFVKAGARLGDVSNAIQNHAEKYGFGVVRSLTGHGIGRKLHEDPSVPNYGKAGSGIALKSGYALAIEPMITLGSYEVFTDRQDGFAVRTRDGQQAAHYENTVIVTDTQAEILTIL